MAGQLLQESVASCCRNHWPVETRIRRDSQIPRDAAFELLKSSILIMFISGAAYGVFEGMDDNQIPQQQQ